MRSWLRVEGRAKTAGWCTLVIGVGMLVTSRTIPE